MKQRVVIAGLTVLGFAAGFATRTWTEADPALPPPPLTLMGEFGKAVVRPASPAQPPSSGSRVRGAQAPDRAKLSAEIQKLRPEIDAYRTRLDALDAEYEVELAKILNPEQRARRAERNQKRAADRELRAKEPAADTPLTDDEISKLRERPMLNLAYTFLVPMHVDMLRRELNLDDAQAEKVAAILRTKRDKIETLVDSVPPPSIMLSRLAPVAERLAVPKK